MSAAVIGSVVTTFAGCIKEKKISASLLLLSSRSPSWEIFNGGGISYKGRESSLVVVVMMLVGIVLK